MLKYRLERVVNCSDWDKLVRNTYDKPYCFQQQDGCQSRGNVHIQIPSEWAEDFENDTIPEKINGGEMGVSFKAWLTRDSKEWNGDKKDERFLDLFWERNFYPELCTIANDLHAKGLIETGNYIINIDW